MAHSHHHHHHDHSHGHRLGNIGAAIAINAVFAVFELVSGILCNSVAVTSDAIHDLGDTLALTLSYLSEKYAGRKINNYTYGLNRLPLLSALLNSLVLLIGSGIVLATAIPRLQHPEQPRADWMIGIALVGVLANGMAVFRLKGEEGLNVKVLSLHLLEDVLGWVAVLIGAVVMYFFDAPIIDPILSIGISIYIVVGVFRNLKSALQLFLQKAPEGVNVQQIKEFIGQLPQVSRITDFHIWSLEGTHHVLTMHLELKEDLSLAECDLLKQHIRSGIHRFGELHTTIELEGAAGNCNDHC